MSCPYGRSVCGVEVGSKEEVLLTREAGHTKSSAGTAGSISIGSRTGEDYIIDLVFFIGSIGIDTGRCAVREDMYSPIQHAFGTVLLSFVNGQTFVVGACCEQ